MSTITAPAAANAAAASSIAPHGSNHGHRLHGPGEQTDASINSSSTAAPGSSQSLFGNLLDSIEQVVASSPTPVGRLVSALSSKI